MIAEPQEQSERAKQEVHKDSAEGKPTMPYYFKFMTPIHVSITCVLGLGIVWNMFLLLVY